jgi:hypothetical protein
MDRRWQLVLDCMGAEEPPFSQGTLAGFRPRLIERDLDRRLVERTVELAARTGRIPDSGGRTECEGGMLSVSAYIGMPPVSCGARPLRSPTSQMPAARER